MKWLLLIGAVAVIALGEPTVEDRMAQQRDEVDRELESRERHIDPGELLGMMHNDRIPLRIVDVREEREFNLFRLRDAERWTSDEQAPGWSPDAVKVVVGTREEKAEDAYRRLRALGVLNVYILEGGVYGWLEAYDPKRPVENGRHQFEAALGDRYPAADPKSAPERKFTPKVKIDLPDAPAGAGCG
ncbi:MAG: rhodanese-like domain-containing protein [Planctomycetota bacterium]|jgi:rhodanese-related sulfurtransferase